MQAKKWFLLRISFLWNFYKMIGSASEPEKKSDLFSSVFSVNKGSFKVTIKKENGFVEHVNNVMQSRFL